MIKRFGVALLALSLGVPVLQPAQAQERLQVVASFSILADVTRQVAGDVAEVTALMPVSTDPHSFEPTPRDLATLAEADVVLVNGLGFEESLMETIENAGEEVNVVAVSPCVTVLPFGLAHEDEAHEDEHAHDEEAATEDTSPLAEQCQAHDAELVTAGVTAEPHAHAGEDEHHAEEPLGVAYTLTCTHSEEEAEDEHAHGSCDPHVWTDPVNVMYWTLAIRDTLSALDPANAVTYTANAAAYVQALIALDSEVAALVETISAEQRVLVTNHETIGYFAHRYGFEVVGVVMAGGSSIAEPSAGEMAALIDLIREEGVNAIFAENTINTSMAEQIADEAEAQVYTLYTDSLSEADGNAPTYVDYLRYNVTTMVEALSQ